MPPTPRPPAAAGRRRTATAVRPESARSQVSPDDRFFRHIVSSMRNAVIAIRRDGTVALVNAEAYRIFALPPQAADVGRPFADVFHGCPDVVRVLAGSFEMTTLPNRAELRLKDVGRVIGYTLSRVKDDEGQTVGAVLFFKDLTQVEQMEERERLRDRLVSLGEMAAGIAHELKNPLAGIEVMAGLLRRQVPDARDAQLLLADIISEAKLANAIVVEMLEFVRPIRLELEQTSLAEVVQQALTLAENKVPRGEIAVQVDLAPELPAIDGDRHQLCQVFTNLLANAFEALGGRGHVRVSAARQFAADHAVAGDSPSRPAPLIAIDVTDDGPGVSEDLRDRIFDPFFTTKPQGSGLGLPIVRKIVDAHDGRIDVTSTPGEGTRFRVTMPVSSTAKWFE